MIKIKIKKLHTDAIIPKYAHEGDAGMDLFSIEKDFILKPKHRKVVGTGVSIELPKGYVSLIWDKSGIASNGIKTMGGVIEYTYRGEYKVVLVNLSNEDYKIKKGQKVAQLLIQPIETVETEEVKELSETPRGEGGFGSTDLNKTTKEFLSTVYIIEEGKVLLTWNKKVNKFIPLGGHVDKDELPCDCAIREAKEESGYDIELIDLGNLKIKNLPQNLDIHLDIIKPDHHHINLSYIGKIVGGKMLDKSDEGTELRWFSPEDIINHPDIFDNTKEKALKAIELVKIKGF